MQNENGHMLTVGTQVTPDPSAFAPIRDGEVQVVDGFVDTTMGWCITSNGEVVGSVNKYMPNTWEAIKQRAAISFDELDKRLDELAKEYENKFGSVELNTYI